MVVGMTRQNYYKDRSSRHRRLLDEEFITELVRQERAVQPVLGGRKLFHMLRDEFHQAGVLIGRDRFFALLGRRGLLIERRLTRPRTTYSNHGFRVYKNLLKDVTLTGPNQAFVSDITYLRTDEGFMYLALVMDAYSRTIVGYDCSDSLESQGALRALSMALRGIASDSNVIHHSDRGCQYCSGAYVEKLQRKGLRVSMTEENHCYENSQAERLNGILKQEYGLGSRFLRKSDALRSVSEAVKLYNYRRPHQSLGYRCPMEVHLAA
jgi:transposase InsO family protein